MQRFKGLLLIMAALGWRVLAEQDDWLLRLAQCGARGCGGGESAQECEMDVLDEECCNETSTCYHQICECARGEYVMNDVVSPLHIGVPQLHCHDNDVISVQWEVADDEVDVVFTVEYRSLSDEDWLPFLITQRRTVALYGLEPASEYKVRVRAVSAAGLRSDPVESDWLSTLAGGETELEPPSSVRLDSITYSLENGTANISWTPGRNQTCMYRVHWFSGKDWHNGERVVQVHVAPLKATLPDLLFSDNYTVFVFSLSSDAVSSQKTDLENGIQTLSCLEALNYNMTICPPDAVQNVTVQQRIPELPVDGITNNGSQSHRASVELTVQWARPPVDPDLYQLIVVDSGYFYIGGGPFTNITLPGNATRAVLNVPVSNDFIVQLSATSAGGEGPAVRHFIKLNPVVEGTKQGWTALILVFVLCALAVGVIVVLLLFTRCSQRCRHGKKLERDRSMKSFEDSERGYKVQSLMPGPTPLVPEGSLIPREHLILGDTLGEGCFGMVCKGLLMGSDKSAMEVAVKRLRVDATAEEERQFSLEMELMKSVGQHPHIVSMIGCCIEGRQRLLVVEYCARGDLQRFLREVWNARTSDISYAQLSHHDYIEFEDRKLMAVFNPSYGLNLQGEVPRRKDTLTLTYADLLSMGRQVAIGMEYLADTRVVHRDLAARNILVCDDRTVKISDFGLSRDVYEQNIYLQSGFTKVPIKWMAIEALQHREYTTQSDVWSFGVLLWEIVTFGASPYPSIPNSALFQHLVKGYRMEKPSFCETDLYVLMLKCWREKPSERPTFSHLKNELDEMLQKNAGADYMRLD